MHVLLGAATVIALIFSPSAGSREVEPTSAQLRAWRDFAAASGNVFDIRWSRSGAPQSIRPPKKLPRSYGRATSQIDAEAIGRRFFDANAALFDLREDLDDFAIAGAEPAGKGWKVWVEQTYRGVPVEGGRYRLRLARDGSFESLEGSWVRDVGREHWISPEEAEHRALEELPAQEWTEVKTELDREKVGRHRRLVYCTRVKGGWAFAAVAWVDPRSGVVLDHQLMKSHILSDPR